MKSCVLVSGDFTPWGGMDRANYELAWHLADRLGIAVHLVSHSVARPLATHTRITWHRVPKPLDSYTLAAPLLRQEGRRIAARLARQGARVIVNGGNCPWPDINWVHAVHAAWDNRDVHAPLWFRVRNRWNKCRARRAECRAVRMARIVLTNSAATRRQIIAHLGIPAGRVQIVYLGSAPEDFRPRGTQGRLEARQRFGWWHDRPMVAFIGALGHDRHKGFDVVFRAWTQLCQDPGWDVDLAVAGGGAEVELWQRQATSAGLTGRIQLLGFVKHVPDLLAAVDAVVSPVSYDAYGLAVHEALCHGLPAFVTRCAGVAERYPDNLADLLLNDPPTVDDLVQRLYRWRRDRAAYAARLIHFGTILRQHTWADMARQIVNIIASVA
jgi:glycosyltransferase involved in cell wall biosynthesis